MQPAAVELLRDLSAVLTKGGYRWYVFGARAASLHGVPRLTEDVDVTAEIPILEVRRFVDEMSPAGFRLKVSEPELDDFVARTRVLPFEHTRTLMHLDIVLAGPGLEEEFLERAVNMSVGDLQVPVATAEDTVVMKILAGRPKDLEDVAAILLRQGAKLNRAKVKDTLRQLETALSRSDLIPQLDQLTGTPAGKRPTAKRTRRKRRQ